MYLIILCVIFGFFIESTLHRNIENRNQHKMSLKNKKPTYIDGDGNQRSTKTQNIVYDFQGVLYDTVTKDPIYDYEQEHINNLNQRIYDKNKKFRYILLHYKTNTLKHEIAKIDEQGNLFETKYDGSYKIIYYTFNNGIKHYDFNHIRYVTKNEFRDYTDGDFIL